VTTRNDQLARPLDRTRAAASAAGSRLVSDRAGPSWFLVVAAVYILTTIAVAMSNPEPRVDRAMGIAANLAHGRLDSGLPPGTLDTVTLGGATYQVISPLPIVPYLLFVPFPFAWEASRWIISTGLGIAAAWLTLPLARRYGPGGSATFWLATLGAFGTLLWTQAISGNFYYLAHVEAMLFTFAALIEWGGRRRPWVVGLALGLAGLARPTVLLAAIPFAIGLLAESRDRWRTAVSFLGPVALAIGLTGLYNALRFGSPLESGYGISVLARPNLAQQRAQGLFSLRHVPDNLGLLIARGFDLQVRFPYLVPDPNGHSILLTSPAVLAAVSAGLRSWSARILWAAAFLILVPLLLYYGGGGYRTYGYRYALDFIPFLLALVAIGAGKQFGSLEKLLIVLSVGFVAYGVVWAVVG
jgi:hypothetical protein